MKHDHPLLPIVHERARKLAEQNGQPIQYDDLVIACADLDRAVVINAIAWMCQTDQLDDDDTRAMGYDGDVILYVNRFD